ncbi:protein phosphatase 1L isoform X2 [Gadus macrocephalus]|uniref:protein phosphatase 1L isoform X2 n=1 Tax=Gadus macrocephalus TaxID=80720 RepID=UPI0028CB1FCE|nr:protein phosphatase 1L isoform X2 [Gadus macrocephalus]
MLRLWQTERGDRNYIDTITRRRNWVSETTGDFIIRPKIASMSPFKCLSNLQTIVKSSRDAVKMVKGKVAEMMMNDRLGGLSVLDAEFSKTWEFKNNNVAVYSIQGRRDHMEDRFEVLTDITNKSHPSIFGIFDGHGGEAAADYVKAHLPEALRQQLQAFERERKESSQSYASILEQRIMAVDRDMLDKLSANHDEAGQEPGMIGGTTCLVALLSDRELTVANVGDSRGVLCDKDGNAVALSHDHKPYQLKERKRIKRAGGFISFNGSWRVQGILAMSRSLGDYPLKNLNVVIPDPDIVTFDLDKLQPEFMILASDGLWDAFSNEEAVRFVRERLDEPHYGAKSIVLQSFYRGCPDNITVMVVRFKSGGGGGKGGAKSGE